MMITQSGANSLRNCIDAAGGLCARLRRATSHVAPHLGAADAGKRVVAQLCEHSTPAASIAQSAAPVPTPCTEGVPLPKQPPRIATHGHPRGFEALMLGGWRVLVEERDKMFQLRVMV
jgi:hypothetical protein